MTKKLAFFVEGQTERIFVQRLITEIAGEYHVKFDIYARSNGVVTFSSIEAPRGAKYAVRAGPANLNSPIGGSPDRRGDDIAHPGAFS